MTDQTSSGLDRRSFLALGAAAAGAAVVPVAAASAVSAATAGRPRVAGDPFTLGVSSGDPLPDSVILWTRLAPKPLDLDAGMPSTDVDVQWEVSTDESFSNLVASGTETAVAQWGHSVHVNVQGLTPDTWYYYRFKQGSFVTETARTRTTPAPGQMPESFVFGQTSCANWQSGYYQLYEDVALHDVDYWLALGDYIYEYGGYNQKKGTGYVRANSAPTRPMPWTTEPVTLQEYRRQYGLYKGDPNLQRLHAVAPYSVIWDDHEVDNNYTGAKSGGDGQKDRGSFLQRRAAAWQAFYENHAIRIDPPTAGASEMRIYRQVDWGALATFLLLDGRQYRSDQPGNNTPNDFGDATDGMFLDSATMLGATQEAWLADALKASTAKWTFIAQQTIVSDLNGGAAFSDPGVFGLGKGLYNYDSWDGYWAARGRLADAIVSGNVRNPVILSGDFHTNCAFNFLSSWPDPRKYKTGAALSAAVKKWKGKTIAAEIACGAVSSPTFFGAGLVAAAGPGTVKNTPWLRYAELLNNGVVINRVTPASVEAEYRVANTLLKKSAKGGAPRTDKTIVIADGKAGIQKVK